MAGRDGESEKVLNEWALEKVGWRRCDCDANCDRWYDTDEMKWNEVPPSVFALAREVIRLSHPEVPPL